MRRPCSLVLLCTCLALAGCSLESKKNRYAEDYRPLNDQVVQVNERLVTTLNTPSSPGKLAAELRPLSGRLARLSREVAALDTPEDLREESEALSRSLARAGQGARRTAGFARHADRPALVAATRRLADDVNALNRRTKRLADAVG